MGRGLSFCECVPCTMDYGLWSKLPTELLEQVLPFLSMPDLCRFRIVCKRWNTVICMPEFGKLCLQNASKGANERVCLVLKLRAFSSETRRWTEIPGWSILDLNVKRWYNLEHKLPKGYDDVSAMDGGLVCAFVDSFTEEQRRAPNCIRNPKTNQDQTFVIFNVFGGTIKVLPNPPLDDANLYCLNLKLVVTNTTNTFKIFLLSKGYCWNPIDPCLCVYESSTNQWRSPSNPPGSSSPHGKFCWDLNSVVFQGLLYVLCESQDESVSVSMLCSFNFLEDSWEDTGVQFQQSHLTFCDLFVSDNRLFLMTRSLVLDHLPLDISKISLADKACRPVVQMTAAEVRRNFSIDSTPGRCTNFNISAFGFNKSILLMSPGTGKVMLYNLVTGLWESLPPNPVESPELLRLGCISRHGKQMSYLRLPNTPW